MEAAIAQGASEPAADLRRDAAERDSGRARAAAADDRHTIVTESALSYLSIGVQPPNASWGTIVEDGQKLLYTRPWVSIAPGIMIVITVLSLNVLGDGVRDALDPRGSQLRAQDGPAC